MKSKIKINSIFLGFTFLPLSIKNEQLSMYSGISRSILWYNVILLFLKSYIFFKCDIIKLTLIKIS
jgi:cytochrome b subunit of formate dehydrogenase